MIVERIATRYHLPPHEVGSFDADFYLRHLKILSEATDG